MPRLGLMSLEERGIPAGTSLLSFFTLILSCMRYVYLNHYSNGYLYVGIHSWKGDGIDPSYHGSSSVAIHHHWSPSKIEILEILDSHDLSRERFWIEAYCTKYGVADCARVLSANSNWYSKYPPHGLMLNLHSSTLEQAMPCAHSSELSRERFKSREDSKEFNRLGLGLCHTKEVQQKANRTRQSKARLCQLSDGFIGTISQVVLHLNMTGVLCTRNSISAMFSKAFKLGKVSYRGVFILPFRESLYAQHNPDYSISHSHPRQGRICKLSDGFIGNFVQVCSHLRFPEGTISSAFSKAYSLGKATVRGVTFEPYEKSL